jgi:hypothetical protein
VRLLAELLGGTYRHGAYTYFPDGQIRRRGTNRRRPCQAQGLPARPACRFSKCGRQRTGGPATASSAAKDVAGSFFVADFAFHHPAPSLMFSALPPTFTLDTPSPPSDISRP